MAENKPNRGTRSFGSRNATPPKRRLTDRQKAAKERLARMTPEQRRTHDPNKAANPRMEKKHPGEIRITKLVTEELGRALRKILKLDGPADVLMSIYFKGAKHLGPRERSIIAEAIYFTMRNLSMITWRMEPIRPDKAAHLTGLVALAMQHGPDALIDQVVGNEKEVLRNILGKKAKDAPKEVQAGIPKWLYDRTVAQYTDHKALYDALREGATLDLRVNTLRASVDEVVKELEEHYVKAEKGQYSPECLRLATKPALTQWPIYKEGKVEVQDEGSQLIARLVQPKRTDMVCDLCAGAGGKTLALGALMKSTGRIYAFDVNERRLEGLVPRMRRAGLSNVHPAVIRNENDNHIKRLFGKLDRVLVDAPCSGTGTYRRNPDLKGRFGEEELERLNLIQKSVLQSGAKMLKAGGRLVYSTCSILRKENQDVIEEFLEKNPDFELLDAAVVLEKQGIVIPPWQRERFGKYFVMLPHLNGTDGFFGAVLQKKKESKAPKAKDEAKSDKPEPMPAEQEKQEEKPVEAPAVEVPAKDAAAAEA